MLENCRFVIKVVSGKFIAIGSVLYPVGLTKNQKWLLAKILKLMHITATQMIAYYSVKFWSDS